MSYKNIIIPLNVFKGENEIYKFLKELMVLSYGYRTFHYFYERGFLEVRIDSENIDEYIDWIKKYFGDVVNKIKVRDYESEIRNYGEEGWKIAEKLFEYFAMAAIHIRLGKGGKENEDNLFRENKFFHCFLNQLGLDSLSEAAFHNFAAQQMLLKHIREIEIPIYAREVTVEETKKQQGPEFG